MMTQLDATAHLRKQLEDFQVSITEAGHLTISPKNGGRDDMILATSLAYIGLNSTGQFGVTSESIKWG
jgi:hypothetical protein